MPPEYIDHLLRLKFATWTNLLNDISILAFPHFKVCMHMSEQVLISVPYLEKMEWL